MAQTAFFIIDLDDQDPGNRSISIDSIYEGNNLWAKSRHFSNGTASDMEDDWDMEFQLRYSQFNTNGAVIFPGTWDSANTCHYLNLTNMVPPARLWFCEIVGTHTAGYIKTFMQGTCDIEYSPGSDTNMVLLLRDWNIDNWTNNVGAQVESNRLEIIVNAADIAANTADLVAYTNAQGVTVTNATLTEATSNTVALSGRILEFTIDTTDSNAVIVAGTGGLTMTAVTNGAVITYTINSGAGTFTNAIIEGVGYSNTFTLAAGTNISINVAGGTNTVDLDIDQDVDMNAKDIDSLGTNEVTISSGTLDGVEGFRIDSGTNSYWLLLQEATSDPFSSLTIEGIEYTTTAIINAGSNVTIRTSGGAAFIDGVAAESTFGTVTNLNIGGSNYTASAILYAGSNVTIRTESGTNFIDGVAAETTFGTMTSLNIEGTAYTNSAILYAGSNTAIRLEGGTNFIDVAIGTNDVSAWAESPASQNVDFGGNIATNYGTPTASDHVIDKGYADSVYGLIGSDNPVDSRDATNDIEMATNDVKWTEVVELTAEIAGGNVSTNDNQITGYASLAPSSVDNLLDGETDSSATTNYYRTSGGTGGDWWFQYDFGDGSNTVITKYILTGFNGNADLNMDNWDFKGSTNGTTWVDLDSQTNRAADLEESTHPNPGVITQEFSNAVAYRYYVFTNIYDRIDNRIQVGELELHNEATPATYTTNIYYALNGKTNTFADSGVLYWDGTRATNSSAVTITTDGIIGDADELDIWVDAPAATNSTGIIGQRAYESGFLYICTTNDTWQRIGITNW